MWPDQPGGQVDVDKIQDSNSMDQKTLDNYGRTVVSVPSSVSLRGFKLLENAKNMDIFFYKCFVFFINFVQINFDVR